MDVLYLSPDFPPNYANFILQLHQRGARVYAMGEADFYHMPEALRSALTYYIRTDLSDPRSVLQATDELIGVKTGRQGAPGFDLVESHNEIWLGLEALINQHLDLDGIRPGHLEHLKKKSVMKQVFMDCGLPVARGGRIRNLAHGLSMADDIGFPLILKPDEGVGASGIHKVEDRDSLEKLLNGLSGDYVMEQFIDAPIVSYDGLVDHTGRIVFENSLIYGDGVLEYVRDQKDTFFYITRYIPEPLSAIGRQLVKAFDIRRKFFHFEFFKTEDRFMPIEINCRPPGGAILDMMNYSADVDLYAAWACLSVDDQVQLPGEKKYFCAYVGRRDRAYALRHEDVKALCGDRLVEFAENPPIFQDAMCRFRYLLRSPNEADLLSLAGKVMALPHA